MSDQKLTPLLEQYFSTKQKYPDGILFFQVGDFFELFFDDAVAGSQALSITLTKRGKCNGQDIPICGVPVSSITHHAAKLVRQGFKVILCEQTSKPIPGEIVQRAVTRILTPGTLTDDLMLDQKKASYLCALWPFGESWSLIFAELLSSKLFTTVFEGEQLKKLESELFRFFPDEILLPDQVDSKAIKQHLNKLGFFVNLVSEDSSLDSWFSFERNEELAEIKKTFFNKPIFDCFFQQQASTKNLALFSTYLAKFHKNFLNQIDEVENYASADFLALDFATIKNLEIFRSSNDGSGVGSLFQIIDKCQTGMGSRFLRQALAFPLKNVAVINSRLNFIEFLKSSFMRLCELENLFKGLADLARIAGRLALDKAGLADLLQLRETLFLLSKIKDFFIKSSKLTEDVFVHNFLREFPSLNGIYDFLQKSLSSELGDQKIAPGFSSLLDELRSVLLNQEQLIANFELEQQKQTGIANLKVKQTDIAGYFIEINSNQLHKVPDGYKLQQSLVGRSRFSCPELIDLASKIFQAQASIVEVEERAFLQILDTVKMCLADLRKAAYLIGQVDMLLGLAKVAYENNFCKPVFVQDETKSPFLNIENGRHPVVEVFNNFVFSANNSYFDQENRCMILTGPNMGGKSTYLRQVALICILAHTGSFVPAELCELSIFDRVFTRIGSGDNLSAGKSTFLVEMEEVATICSLATKNSLIILDEVGRGTSTFDGMALARAILEYLHDEVHAFVLFATHYHELSSLSQTKSAIKNYFVSCQFNEETDSLKFLHKLVQGASKASFGIAVAKLAGVNQKIISRAKTILSELEN